MSCNLVRKTCMLRFKEICTTGYMSACIRCSVFLFFMIRTVRLSEVCIGKQGMIIKKPKDKVTEGKTWDRALWCIVLLYTYVLDKVCQPASILCQHARLLRLHARVFGWHPIYLSLLENIILILVEFTCASTCIWHHARCNVII